MEVTCEQVLMAIMKKLPYPEQIKDLKITESGIYFTWRDTDFKASFPTYSIEEVVGSCLAGSNIAIVTRELIKPGLV